jgi:hypothetical protein
VVDQKAVFRAFQRGIRTSLLRDATMDGLEASMRSMLILLTVTGLASPVYADEVRSFGYARLGYGSLFAGPVRHAPAIGFGYRGELENFALDVSFLNYVIGGDPYATGTQVFAGSVLRLQAFHFLNAEADRSMYVGGGLSWGGVSVGRTPTSTTYLSSWHGSGLQGEATVGYELTRSSPVRIFVQADVGLPFFYARSETYPNTRTPIGIPPVSTSERRYIPSAAVSLGIGWQRHRP